MFRAYYPEGDPSRGGFVLDLDGGTARGRSEKLASGNGVMEREVTRDGIRLAYEEDGSYFVVDQTEDELQMSLGKVMTARYDRDSMALLSFECSLVWLGAMAKRAGVVEDEVDLDRVMSVFEGGEDVRILIDMESERPGITFFRTNARDEVSKIEGGELLDAVDPASFETMDEPIFYVWMGNVPGLGFGIGVAVEEERIVLGLPGRFQAFEVPVSGYCSWIVTSQVTGEEVKSAFPEAFPAANFDDSDSEEE